MRFFRRFGRRFQPRYLLEYLGALLLVYGIRSMSPRFAWTSARLIARLIYRLGLRRKTILRNLEVAFPEKTLAEREEIGARCFEHFFSMGVDILMQTRMLSRRNVFEKIEFVEWLKNHLDTHGLDGLQRRAHGVLFMTAHLGNWELGSGVFGLIGIETVPVFREMRNPYVDKLLRRIRLAQADRVIERRGAVQAMLDHFETGGNIGFLFDQEAIHGPYIPFFGVPACTHKTPAVLARDHGVRIFFGAVVRRGDFLEYQARGQMLEFESTDDKQADIERITRDLVRRLEDEIRLRPEQYFWMHRRWKRSGVHGHKYLPEKMK